MSQSSLSGYRKVRFILIGAAILTVAMVSLSVMALSTLEALANDDPQKSWTEAGTQDLSGAAEEVYVRSLRFADQAVGDLIPRIQCPAGYAATLYAQGLSSPDGLAFSPSGVLHVAEETAGRVSLIDPGGNITTVVSGLTNPEGIAFDADGNLYVVEDVEDGRLLRVTPGGDTTTLATSLDAPEGVVWASDGTTYITESNLQFASDPSDFRTQVTAVSPSGGVTVLRTDDLYWSYAGIALGADGLLYVTNEASGTGTNHSVFTVDPATETRELFATGLVAPEGLRFAAGGGFPLYVAEEDTGGGAGRLSLIEADGSHTPFCTGFGTIEDVAVDDGGRLYVSEDSTGFIIVIEYNVLPINLSISKTVTPTANVTYHGTVTYTVVLSNSGAGHATSVLLTDTLPDRVDFASWVVQPASANETNDQITWNGTVMAGTAITFTFVVTHTGDYGDVVTNRAEYSHTTGGGSDDATFTVEPAPSLEIIKTVMPETDVTYRGVVTYTIVLSNSGTTDADDTLLTDPLPGEVDFARWVVQPANANETNDQITWNGTVTASTAITFTFVVTHTGDYGDVVTNTAEYSHISGIGSDDATFTVESSGYSIYLPIILKGTQP